MCLVQEHHTISPARPGLQPIPSNRPFAGSGHMVQNKLHWNANNAVGLTKQKNSYHWQSSKLTMRQPCLHKSMVQCTCTLLFISKEKMGLSPLNRGRWDYGRHYPLKKGVLGQKNLQWEGEEGQGWNPSAKERKVLDLLRLVST